jgi:hypothetical protein
MLTDYIPDEPSKIDTALHYIIYKIVKTDLSFGEAEAIAKALSNMKVSNNPDKITLAMRPAHMVADIPYIPEDLSEYLEKTLDPIKGHLSRDDYSGNSEEAIQKTLLTMIETKKEDPAFIDWAFENNLWLQVDDHNKRLEIQYEFLEAYLKRVTDPAERRTLMSDYILEMEHGGEDAWAEKGRVLLQKEIEKN